MTELAALDLPSDPRLAHNITWFARALRAAGMPIGPGRVVDAIRAVETAGFGERADFYWTLHACFVSRPEHRAVFDQVFRLYWRDPRYIEHMMALLTPQIRGTQEERRARPGEKRAAEALLDGVDRPPPDRPEVPGEETQIEADASSTASATERLRTLDFEQMSNAEMAQARRLIAQMRIPVRPLSSRRTVPDASGRLADWRGTVRRSLRTGGEPVVMARRRRRARWPDLVALCDISGSMSRYSRAVLHFLHAASNARGETWGRIHAFTFGTRLTNITRHLRTRDVDAALASAGAQAQDWEGGTRIGASIEAFNRDWSRRVLSRGAVVLLISDGLERDDPDRLSVAMERLHLSARRLIWVNPLLRYDGFVPRARGIAAMLPHVDSLRSGHDIASLEGLARALAESDDTGVIRQIRARM